MFVGNTLAGVFVYALQVAMGRMLEVTDYSLFTALMGIFNVTALPLTALLLVVTRNVALELGRDRPERAGAVRAQAVRELGIGGGALVLVALALSDPVSSLLDSPSVLPVVLLWLAVGVNLFTALGSSTLQGMQRFPQLATVSAGISAGRLGICVALVAAGFGIAGSMTGLLASVAIGGVAAWVLVDHGLPRRFNDRSKRKLFASREAAILAGSNLAFIALTQVDYIIVRIFCTPEQASLYSAGAVLAKSVLWLPVGIAIALFPTVASHHARGERSRHVLFQALGMAAITSGLLAGVLAVGAGFWIHLLYGEAYVGAAAYLRWLSLIYLPLALVLVVDNYQLALGRARFLWLYGLGAAAQTIAFATSGSTSPNLLVWILAASSAACFAWGVWVVLSGQRALEPGSSKAG